MALPSLLLLGLMLGGCAVSRLEDVPSTAALDAAAAPRSADLLVPPPEYLSAAAPKPVASLEQTAGDAASLASPPPSAGIGDLASAAPAAPEAFTRTELPGGATWLVRYGAEGYDAEDANGNYCSGQVLDGNSMPRPGMRVKLACNTGEMAQLVIGSAEGGAGTGSILLGEETRAAVIR